MPNNDAYVRENAPPVGFFGPVDSAEVIERGDACYWDTNDIKPASSLTDQGTEALNQARFAQLWAGIAQDASPSGETRDIFVASSVVASLPTDSATFEPGDFLAPDEASSGTALEDRNWVKVTDRNLACAVAVERKATADTTVRAVLLPGYALPGSKHALGDAAIAAEARTLTGTLTLTANDAETQLLDPGGAARTVTLPAEAAFLQFTIINTGNGDEPLTVNNDAGTKQALLERGGRATFVSDGTSWFVMASRQDTNEINVETLSGNKTGAITDPLYQVLDPGGADRTYTLAAEAAMVGKGILTVVNSADGDETIRIEDDANAAVKFLRRGERCELACDGTSWYVVSESFTTKYAASKTGTQTLTDSDLPIQLIDPQGSVNVDLPAEAVTNRPFRIVNTGSGGEIITIRDDGATTICTIDADETALVEPHSGTAWIGTFGVKST